MKAGHKKVKLSEYAVERLQKFRMRIRNKIVDQYHARTPLGNNGLFMVPWEAHHEGSRTLWEAQTTDYVSYCLTVGKIGVYTWL